MDTDMDKDLVNFYRYIKMKMQFKSLSVTCLKKLSFPKNTIKENFKKELIEDVKIFKCLTDVICVIDLRKK